MIATDGDKVESRDEVDALPKIGFREDLRLSYGIHRFRLGELSVAALSARNWDEYATFLSDFSDDDVQVTVSPELITGVCDLPETAKEQRKTVNSHIAHVLDVSGRNRHSLFLLGTAFYDSEEGLPTNSVLVVKDGRVAGRTNKRTQILGSEKENFVAMPSELPYTIPGTDVGILICSDLPRQVLFLAHRRFAESGKDGVVWDGKSMADAVGCVDPFVRHLIIVSCWGVGGRTRGAPDPDVYYRNSALDHMRRLIHRSSVESILMVDRAPSLMGGFVTTRPLNMLVERVVLK